MEHSVKVLLHTTQYYPQYVIKAYPQIKVYGVKHIRKHYTQITHTIKRNASNSLRYKTNSNKTTK